MPSIKMLDLIMEIDFKTKYLKGFAVQLEGEDIEIAETKYNINRINEHLEKIDKEYEQLIDELDEIIFKGEEKCQKTEW